MLAETNCVFFLCFLSIGFFSTCSYGDAVWFCGRPPFVILLFCLLVMTDGACTICVHHCRYDQSVCNTADKTDTVFLLS